MRALILNISSQLGGTERVVYDLMRHLPDSGIEARLVVPGEGPLTEQLRMGYADVRVVPAPIGFLETGRSDGLVRKLGKISLGSAAWARSISEAGADRDTTFLYTHGFKPHLTGMFLDTRPWIWHLHEMLPEGLTTPWRMALSNASSAIAISKAVRNSWSRVTDTPIRLVYNGVDLEDFGATPRTGWLRSRLGIGETSIVIGMPAVLAHWKGQLEAIKALPYVRLNHPGAHLVLVGGQIYDTQSDRGYEATVDEAVREAGGAEAGVHRLPFMNDVEKLYPEFDVCVSYSTRAEPFGRTIIEALASGIPVVAADEGGPAEILGDAGMAGKLVEPRSPEALGQGIVDVLARDLSRRSEAAHEQAKRFSAERFAAGVGRCLRSTLKPSD